MKGRRKKIVIAPYDSTLLEKLQNYNIIVETEDSEAIISINKALRKKSHLFCIKFNSCTPLSGIELNKEWIDIPLAIYTPSLGELSKVLLRARQLKSMNLTIFLPADEKQNIRDLRILSSLGIDCGFCVRNKEDNIDWDSIDDLFYYSAYSKTKRGQIEPFRFMLSDDYQDSRYRFTAAMFDDPALFVYIDSEMNLAVSRENLDKGEYSGEGLEELKQIVDKGADQPEIGEYRNRMFIDNELCSYCSAMRTCRSVYFNQCQKDEAYKQLFEDILVFKESRPDNNGKNQKVRKWQL